MATKIDSLEIEIQSNSSGAAAGLESLAGALEKIKKSTVSSTAVKNLRDLTSAMKELTPVASNAKKLESLADSLSKLSAVGSLRGITNQLKALPGALKGLSGLSVDSSVGTKISSLASALAPLSQVKTGGFGTLVNGLSKISEVTKKLDDGTLARFAERIKKLNEIVGPLSAKMTTLQAGFRGINTSSRSAGEGVAHFDSKIKANRVNLASLVTIVQGAIAALRPLIRLFSSTISQAMEWEGIAERFGRGFGDQAEDVYKWVQKLNKEMGLNTQQFMQYSSIFSTMLQGFGVSMKDSAKMAVGYTELTYDIWAGYNDVYKRFEDAAEAVKSAIAGEVEPIRRAGFTIVESTLEQTAANHGLKISLEKATEAQKSYLRYLTLVDQAHTQNLVGTYAKEMNTAEGLTRTLAQQLKSLAQAFGSLFLPILIKVMPWLQAFVDLLREAIVAAASFFGIDIQPVDWSGLGDGEKGLGNIGDAAKDTKNDLDKATKAAKELRNATIGIDELNVISPPTSSGGTGGSGSTSGSGGFDGLDIGSIWDDSIFEQVQFEVEQIKEKIKEALSGITAVISGFVLAVGTILVVSGANIPMGLALMAVGAVGLVATIVENWSAMSDELAKTLTTITSVLGGFLLAIGAFLAFSGVNVPLGAGLMVAGAVSLATAATINWKFLEGDITNTLSIITGIISGGLIAMGALFAFTGVDVPLGIGLMVAGAVGLATAAALNWDSLTEPMRKTIGTLEAIVGGGLLALGGVLAFTGANIPLGVGMLAAGAVSIVSAAALNWKALDGPMKDKILTITALVSGALLGIGAILALTGVATPLGIGMIAVGAVGIVASASLDWSSLANKLANVLKEIGIAVGAALLALGVILALTGVALPLGVALILAGSASLAAGITLNWDSIKSKITEAFDKIKEWVQTYGLLVLGILLCFTAAGIPTGLALIKKGLSVKTDSGATVGEELLETVKEKWNALKTWWDSKPELKEISTKINDIKAKVSGAWDSAKNWWNSKPVLKEISTTIGSIKDKVSSAWTTAKNWWTNNKGSLSHTPTIGNIKDKLSSAWSTAKTWWTNSKGSLSMTPTIGSIKDKLSSAWSTAKKWWSDNVKLSIPSLSFKVTYTTKGLNGVQKAVVKALGLDGWPKLSFAASGGIFDMGSLIWAGESGAEIVANAGGGKTGVMNVAQMQDAVYEGVYAAVTAAMRSNGGNGGGQVVKVYLDGREITASVERTQFERGATIMGNQVYAF